jgi:hypothetical protein
MRHNLDHFECETTKTMLITQMNRLREANERRLSRVWQLHGEELRTLMATYERHKQPTFSHSNSFRRLQSTGDGDDSCSLRSTVQCRMSKSGSGFTAVSNEESDFDVFRAPQGFCASTIYRVFHFEVSISAPRLDLGSKSQQILTLARARSIWDSEPLGAKARAMAVDFSDALDVKPVR